VGLPFFPLRLLAPQPLPCLHTHAKQQHAHPPDRDIPVGTYPTEKLIDGATGTALTYPEDGVESNLDFTAAMPLIWPQKAILFQTDDEYYEMLEQNPVGSNQYPGFWNSECWTHSRLLVFWPSICISFLLVCM
jgi:hypothetical protein